MARETHLKNYLLNLANAVSGHCVGFKSEDQNDDSCGSRKVSSLSALLSINNRIRLASSADIPAACHVDVKESSRSGGGSTYDTTRIIVLAVRIFSETEVEVENQSPVSIDLRNYLLQVCEGSTAVSLRHKNLQVRHGSMLLKPGATVVVEMAGTPAAAALRGSANPDMRFITPNEADAVVSLVCHLGRTSEFATRGTNFDTTKEAADDYERTHIRQCFEKGGWSVATTPRVIE